MTGETSFTVGVILRLVKKKKKIILPQSKSAAREESSPISRLFVYIYIYIYKKQLVNHKSTLVLILYEVH